MTTPSMNRRGRYWRRFVAGLCAASLLLQVGCYTFKPLQTSAPVTGNRIAVVLNDRGRFTLGDRLGSAVDNVDGLLVAVDSTTVTLEVYRTTDLRGGTASWTGERVLMPKDAIVGYQERQFSKRRTYVLVATVVGVIAATMMMTNLNLFNGANHPDPGGGTTGNTR